MATFTFGRPHQRSTGIAQRCRLNYYSGCDKAHSIPYLEMEPMLPLVIGPGGIGEGWPGRGYRLEGQALRDFQAEGRGRLTAD